MLDARGITVRNRCTASLFPFLTFLPFLSLWAVPLASWGRRYLEGKGLLSNSIWPYLRRSRSCVTSLQSVKAVHRSQNLPFTRGASAKRKSEAPLEGNPSPSCPLGLAPAPPTPRRPRPPCSGCASVTSAGTTRIARKDPAQVTETHPSTAQVPHRCYRLERARAGLGTP